jgi:hypothetical protein
MTVDQFVAQVKTDHISGKLGVYEIQALIDRKGFGPLDTEEILRRLLLLRRAQFRRPRQKRSTKPVKVSWPTTDVHAPGN